MRCMSISRIKGTIRGKKYKPLSNKPRWGTKTRRMFDYLQAHKAEPVTLDTYGDRGTIKIMISRLMDFYGLDIRLTRGTRLHGNRHAEYTLVGEWFGKVYVDYVAEKMEKS